MSTPRPTVPKVSVVVPVYNPGPHIDDLIASLLRQTMSPDDFEVIFVDDGSTDGTGARLDELAATHPHMAVRHIPNSGWPSRPRNLGIDQARGTYIQFVDNDDWLGDEALQRLYAYAVVNDADVIVGRMSGRRRNVPRELFRTNHPAATLANAPLIDSLTPHKMFRRDFLLEHTLRFPEGDRRLEDHVFVTAAYFAARRISVLSDYVCYYHVARPDASNAGFRRFDPAGYFGNLREALDIVDQHTEPGTLRDKLHRRWLRVEIIDRLSGRRFLDAPEEWRADFFREARTLVTERFAPSVAAGLPASRRVAAELLVRNDIGSVQELARWESGIRAQASARVSPSLEITATGELRSGRTAPPFTRTSRGTDTLAVPVPDIAPEILDVTQRLRSARMDILARRSGGGGEEFFLPATTSFARLPVEGGEESGFGVLHTTVARLAPDTLNSGRNAGTWDLKVRITSCGWQRDADLAISLTIATDGAPPVVTDRRHRSRLTRAKRSARRRARQALARLRRLL
ncbi:glycosyltransferase family 2 protein [Streptomyces sp. NPDC057136]|uniref:glycosyltransferase family 2 protein n=1 Tax=Streptomyces sp. NPDC057136 TaxID=3346029 RepID=UPI003632304B